MTRKRTPEKLTRAMLRDAAGPVYFGRGEEYFDLEYVQAVRARDGIIHATVHGTQPYKTVLMLSNGEVDGKCSCPLGRDGEFCKHLVATGLQYIDQQKSGKTSKGKNKPVTPKEVEAYLSRLDGPELVRIIMEQADIDDEFYAMLKLRVAAESASSNTSEMRRVLKQAMTIHDFVSWRDTSTYTRGVDRVLGQLRTMLTPKHAGEVIELVEYAMDLWEENIGLIDDSDGCMGMIRDDLHQLHFEACSVAKPDPVALAERIAQRTIASEWEMFYGSYEAYRDIFGSSGCARYREIVEARWNDLPTFGPGQDDSSPYERFFTLDRMMLSIAEGEGDLELVIRVMSRDLSHGYGYLQIAERCKQARKHKLALEWAEKGLAAFPDEPDSRLRSFLAEAYLRANRPDDVMAMVWANFTERTTLENYQDLAKYAQKLDCWDAWRKKAFAYVREDLKNRKAEFERKFADHPARKDSIYLRWAPQSPDLSLLVAILLWEKNEDKAWAEAQNGGCANHLWLDLAKRREKKKPEDAIEIYRRQVVPLIEQTNNNSYNQAIEFMGRVNKLMKQMGKEEEFGVWLAQLRTEYKRKRNFIKYLERTPFGKTMRK